jgi:hypothetical protein
MYEVLRKADLRSGSIGGVEMSTMYGLEARGLVAKTWRGGKLPNETPRVVRTQPPSRLPNWDEPEFRHCSGELTATGVRAAWLVRDRPISEEEIAPIIAESPGDETPLGDMWIRPRRRR